MKWIIYYQIAVSSSAYSYHPIRHRNHHRECDTSSRLQLQSVQRNSASGRVVGSLRCSMDNQDDCRNTKQSAQAIQQSASPQSTQQSAFNNFEDTLFLERFKRRRNELYSKLSHERTLHPPSNSSHFQNPQNVITSLLHSLLTPHSPVPYFGYEILYQSSTVHWKDVLRKSVGAPIGTDEELIYRALGGSMEREGNQFGLLVGLGTDTDDDVVATEDYATIDSAMVESNSKEGRYYTIEFPFDTLDYYDGTAWLECRLRHAQSDALLAVLGWSMKRGGEDESCWLVDGIDWQDFRERHRPGIGREEWERICG